MTDSNPPSPPSCLPEESLDSLAPAQLRAVAEYAADLAAYRERETRRAEADASEASPDTETPPSGVPSKASLTTKQINGNRYYYWQWRDGDQIKSKYKGPVEPSE